MNSIKVNLSKGAISEVKLKKSPSVSRITKQPELMISQVKRKRLDSENKENFESLNRPKQPMIYNTGVTLKLM
jgi:hypothetical protein